MSAVHPATPGLDDLGVERDDTVERSHLALDLTSSALLVVDVQRDVPDEGEHPIRGTSAVAPAVRVLNETVRAVTPARIDDLSPVATHLLRTADCAAAQVEAQSAEPAPTHPSNR